MFYASSKLIEQFILFDLTFKNYLLNFVLTFEYFREDCKVCHYIVNKVNEENDGTKYKIGDRHFPDLPSLLSFYKLHYLDTTPLVRPATRKFEKVIAKHDFDGAVSAV